MTKSSTKKSTAENVEKPEQVSLQDATVEQLKAAAFDVSQKIQVLQGQYQTILGELKGREHP